MRQKKMIYKLDKERIEAAIAEAERKSSGEIRVSVAPFFWGNVQRVAERAFERLGMTATQERNGILFFVVPARRRFVVLGDAGIHEKVGQSFWERISAVVGEKFHAGQFTEGLIEGIHLAGEELARHFPCDRTRDVNELPNTLDTGDAPPEP